MERTLKRVRFKFKKNKKTKKQKIEKMKNPKNEKMKNPKNEKITTLINVCEKFGMDIFKDTPDIEDAAHHIITSTDNDENWSVSQLIKETRAFIKTTTTNKYFNRLNELKNQFPLLTLQNMGYEKLSKEIQESHKEQIDEIEKICKETIEGFRSFNNFKERKDDVFALRVQYAWDSSFTGVGYFPIDDFKHFEL